MLANWSVFSSRPSVVMMYCDTWPLRRRRLADLAGRHLDVLRLHGDDDVLGVQAVGRQLLRIEPEPHAVIALAEIGDVADAGQTRQLVADLDRGVVAQLQVGAARRRSRTG